MKRREKQIKCKWCLFDWLLFTAIIGAIALICYGTAKNAERESIRRAQQKTAMLAINYGTNILL